MVDIVGYDESKKKRTTCGQCTAILDYTLKEVKSRIDHDYGGGYDTFYYIDCPGCGHKVEVKGY